MIGVTVATEMAISNTLQNYLPDYFSADSKQIIENQQKNFEKLQSAMDELIASVNDPAQKQLVADVQKGFADARDQNDNLIQTLGSMREENLKLREMLKLKHNIDGGTDFYRHGVGALPLEDGVAFWSDQGRENGSCRTNIFSSRTPNRLPENRGKHKIRDGKQKVCDSAFGNGGKSSEILPVLLRRNENARKWPWEDLI